MISFSVGEQIVSTSHFQQASFEIIFDRLDKKYIHRFSGNINVDKAQDVIDFLTENIVNLITVAHEDKLILNNCTITFMGIDPIINACRIELQQDVI